MTMRLWSAAAVGVPGRAIVGRMAAAALLAAMLTACSGGSSYRYVANRENGNFFKVPSSWKLEDITAADAADRPTETASNVRSVWHTVFSGGVPVPGGGEPAEVVGSAQIFLVSASYREQLSLSSIRTQIFGGVDPLFAPDELVGSSVRVVSYTALQGGTGVTPAMAPCPRPARRAGCWRATSTSTARWARRTSTPSWRRGRPATPTPATSTATASPTDATSSVPSDGSQRRRTKPCGAERTEPPRELRDGASGGQVPRTSP